MAVWDELKHKRFHGKFVSMGMNVRELRDKHNVHIKPGTGNNAVYHGARPGMPGGHGGNHIGVVHKHPSGGFKAFVNQDKGVQAVSEHPFRSRAEAAAAIAAAHPAVKTLNNTSVIGSHGPPSESVQAKMRGIKAMGGAKVSTAEFDALHEWLGSDALPPTIFQKLARSNGDLSVLNAQELSTLQTALEHDPAVRNKPEAKSLLRKVRR